MTVESERSWERKRREEGKKDRTGKSQKLIERRIEKGRKRKRI